MIGPGYLSSLTNLSGIKMVIKHIPVPFAVLAKMLNKEISDLINQEISDTIIWN